MASLFFAFLVVNIPTIQVVDRPRFGEHFLEYVLLIFVLSTLLGSLLKLDRLIPILLIVVFIIPHTNVTASGWYNIVSTGILFGSLFQFRFHRIHLVKHHWFLFIALLLLGLYYNLIPMFFGDNDGFNNKLWLYNIYVFIKYLYVGLLIIQVRFTLDKITKHILWFGFLYALFIIIEAYHIQPINLWMKMFTIYGYISIDDNVQRIAYNYFRAAGLGIDANFAGIKTAILMAVVLYRYKTNRQTIIWLVPFMFLAIWLTGSKASLILGVVVLTIWTFHAFMNLRDFKKQRDWRMVVSYLWFFMVFFNVFMFIGIQNDSFKKTFDTGKDRYAAFISGEAIESDESTSFRIKEITDISLTSFGDRSDHLLTVHSELARLLRFYGVMGITLTIAFWLFYLFIIRRSYLAVTLVTLIALNSFWKWVFHSEDVFMPVFVITVIILNGYKTESKPPLDPPFERIANDAVENKMAIHNSTDSRHL